MEQYSSILEEALARIDKDKRVVLAQPKDSFSLQELSGDVEVEPETLEEAAESGGDLKEELPQQNAKPTKEDKEIAEALVEDPDVVDPDVVDPSTLEVYDPITGAYNEDSMQGEYTMQKLIDAGKVPTGDIDFSNQSWKKAPGSNNAPYVRIRTFVTLHRTGKDDLVGVRFHKYGQNGAVNLGTEGEETNFKKALEDPSQHIQSPESVRTLLSWYENESVARQHARLSSEKGEGFEKIRRPSPSKSGVPKTPNLNGFLMAVPEGVRQRIYKHIMEDPSGVEGLSPYDQTIWEHLKEFSNWPGKLPWTAPVRLVRDPSLAEYTSEDRRTGELSRDYADILNDTWNQLPTIDFLRTWYRAGQGKREKTRPRGEDSFGPSSNTASYIHFTGFIDKDKPWNFMHTNVLPIKWTSLQTHEDFTRILDAQYDNIDSGLYDDFLMRGPKIEAFMKAFYNHVQKRERDLPASKKLDLGGDKLLERLNFEKPGEWGQSVRALEERISFLEHPELVQKRLNEYFAEFVKKPENQKTYKSISDFRDKFAENPIAANMDLPGLDEPKTEAALSFRHKLVLAGKEDQIAGDRDGNLYKNAEELVAANAPIFRKALEDQVANLNNIALGPVREILDAIRGMDEALA